MEGHNQATMNSNLKEAEELSCACGDRQEVWLCHLNVIRLVKIENAKERAIVVKSQHQRVQGIH